MPDSASSDDGSHGEPSRTNGSGDGARTTVRAGRRRGRSVRRRVAPGQKQRRFRERVNAYRASRREGRPPRHPKVMVPSFFTLMNLFSGFLALTQIHEGEFVRACQLIVLAGFFDALDGLTARLTDATSDFGVELDSLSDVVSFGIAPAYLVWVFGLNAFGPLGLLVASLPALCGAVRLARYNVMFGDDKQDYFEGLPIPAQAVTIVALILVLNDAAWVAQVNLASIMVPTVFFLALLMVSSVRFDAFPKPTLEYIRTHPRRSILYTVALLLLPIFREYVLLALMGGYVLYGVGETIYRVVRAVLDTPVDDVPVQDGPEP